MPDLIDDYEIEKFKKSKWEEFEEKLWLKKYNISNWINYGEWEFGMNEFKRGRSVFERGLNNFPY